MAIDTPLITQAQFQDVTKVSANLDPRWWQAHVANVQYDIVRELLGEALMDELQTQAPAFSAENQALMDAGLTRAVCYYTLEAALPELQYRIDNKGVVVNADATAAPADAMTVQSLLSRARTRAESWMNAALRLLKDNATDYPLYVAPCGCGGATTIQGLNTAKLKNRTCRN